MSKLQSARNLAKKGLNKSLNKVEKASMENEDSSENNESTLEETQPTGKSEIDYPGKDATKVEKQSKVSSAENNKSRFKFIIL